MLEFDKIFEGERASFKRIAVHNTEHINGVILGVERGDFAGQDKVVPHKDGTYHHDTDIFLSPERYDREISGSSEKPDLTVRSPLQGEFQLPTRVNLKPLKLAKV